MRYLNSFRATMFVLVLSALAFAAHYPIEIIQPQESLNTQSRFYKAYPGIEYKINVAVIGGAWPFEHELVAAPAGMTVDKDKGIITWPSPTTSGSPHLVSVKVTDQEGSIDNHTWTITVATDGFLFVDAQNGKTRAEGGTGTINNPFKGIAGWYCINTVPEEYNAKYEITYPGNFVYYKTGVYKINDWDNHGYLNLIPDRKPKVHMAFPGHKPVFDCTISYWTIEDKDNTYWEGFEFANIVNPGRHAISGIHGDNSTIVRNVFHNMAHKSGSHNQSPIFYSASVVRKHCAIMDNEFYDLDKGYCLLSYHTEKTVYERNWSHDINPTEPTHHCIGLKVSSPRWFIRNNRFTNLSGATEAIWLYFSRTYNGNTTNNEQVEVSYNLVLHNERSAGASLILGGHRDPYGEVWIFRNTLVGSQIPLYINSATDGPVSIYNNVIVNEYSMYDNHVNIKSPEYADRIIFDNNVSGKPSDGVVDANGMLTAAYSQYEGTHGHYWDGITASIRPAAQQVRMLAQPRLTQAYDILGRRIPVAINGKALTRSTGIVVARNQQTQLRTGTSLQMH